MTAQRSQPLSAVRHGVPLADKVAFLQRPDTYAKPTHRVESIETHMAWVFLTETRAYKLKKPVRYAYLDFSSLEARRIDTFEEVRLNRVLAPDVYLGTVPLTRITGTEMGETHDGGHSTAMALDGDGSVIDWLVVMRRLSRERMLDAVLEARTWSAGEIDLVVRWLIRFYQYAPRIDLPADVYLAGLRRDIRENRDELWSMQALPEPDRPLVQAVADRLLRCTHAHATRLGRRAADRRIVEGHGDLRPEHVHLGPPPAVIDCIEFNRGFRILDIVDDLGFLRLECERLGAASVGEQIFETYRTAMDDAVDETVVAFYMAHRALLRAKIALWHLNDHDVRLADRWLERTLEYLQLAAMNAERAET